MRIAEVIGRVTLSRCHPSLKGSAWRLVVPLTWEGLIDRTHGRGEAFVAYDDQRSGIGDLIAVSEGERLRLLSTLR
jgi:microcompartment protein CcmK/EutM